MNHQQKMTKKPKNIMKLFENPLGGRNDIILTWNDTKGHEMTWTDMKQHDMK